LSSKEFFNEEEHISKGYFPVNILLFFLVTFCYSEYVTDSLCNYTVFVQLDFCSFFLTEVVSAKGQGRNFYFRLKGFFLPESFFLAIKVKRKYSTKRFQKTKLSLQADRNLLSFLQRQQCKKRQ